MSVDYLKFHLSQAGLVSRNMLVVLTASSLVSCFCLKVSCTRALLEKGPGSCLISDKMVASSPSHGGLGSALRGPNRSLLEASLISKQFANLSHGLGFPLLIVFV
ncbi:unnamed protein product [Alternaria burnsii]|nr:unnamed protein product [Alternaria burnsii]